jgi:hypothetical protein
MSRDDNPHYGDEIRELAAREKDWTRWLPFMFPQIQYQFAPHHAEFWDWLWSIERGVAPKPYVAIWPRGGGKTASAQLGIAALGAFNLRRYFIYVKSSQERADDAVREIASVLESRQMALWYPEMADRSLSRFGHAKGWRRNRLHTRGGFIIDALGLDTASRGLKVEFQRPDGLVLDDIDDSLDTEATTARKIDTLTKRILPATTSDAVIIAIQNLIHHDSIFAQMVDGRAEFLADRIVSGPIPAITDLQYQTEIEDEGRARVRITGGSPTWVGLDIAACEKEIAKEGISVFLSEVQHVTPKATGGMFDHIVFQRVAPENVPDLDKVVCWVDPAVTDSDSSDAMGIQIDGISRAGVLFRLWSWEQRATPLEALRLAITQAEHHGATYVGIETDQGGDTWGPTFREARDSLGSKYAHLTMRSRKAGAGYGNKVHRASQMLADYERGFIVHVEGTHHILEQALIRFPRSKPFDLVDACLVADTRIATRRGEIPIQDVTTDDEVLTSQGWRRVLWSGKTGEREVGLMPSTGLRATADHPIWTENRGWVPFAQLRLSDMVITWRGQKLTRDGYPESKLSTTQSSTRGIPRLEPAIIGCITPACPRHGLAASIDTYTRMLLAQSLEESKSITSMETMTTTIPRTSLLYLPESIDVFTAQHGQIRPQCWLISKKYGQWLRSGMGVRRDENGMSSTEDDLGMNASIDELSVACAGSPSGVGIPVRSNSVPQNAGTTTSTIPTTSSPPLALSAESSSYDPSTKVKGWSAADNAAVFAVEGVVEVFNLKVEDVPEFFANGILVHNCSWAHNDLRRFGRPATLKSAVGYRIPESRVSSRLSSPSRPRLKLVLPGAAPPIHRPPLPSRGRR